MSIFLRIWLAFAVVLMLGIFFLLNALQNQVKPNMRQVVEDTLADNAHVIAALVAADVAKGRIKNADFNREIQATLRRTLNAKIWSTTKKEVQLQLYITDTRGMVLYDSTGKDTGQDFSQWNDVYLTLRGQYGARSTRMNPNDENSSTMFVAAPIVYNQRLIGVVSVGKPGRTVQPYIEQAQRDMLVRAGVMLIVSLLLCALVAWWLRHSIDKVRRYALALAPLGQPAPHFFSARELNELSTAVEHMRIQLEDRAYVEQYVHTLTHELKSPLTAITASAELLQDELPPEDQRRFAQNIGQQTERLLQLVERLLLLARLEKRHDEFEKQTIDLVELVDTAIEQRQSLLTSKQIVIDNQLPTHLSIQAEPFWLAHAVGNVLDNAIDFSLPDHTITLRLLEQSPKITLCIRNVGAQIPDYALPQVFDRYYSLPRPATGRKSTGIGLTLVKEVMERHQGRAQIENTSDGVQVILTF